MINQSIKSLIPLSNPSIHVYIYNKIKSKINAKLHVATALNFVSLASEAVVRGYESVALGHKASCHIRVTAAHLPTFPQALPLHRPPAKEDELLGGMCSSLSA